MAVTIGTDWTLLGTKIAGGDDNVYFQYYAKYSNLTNSGCTLTFSVSHAVWGNDEKAIVTGNAKYTGKDGNTTIFSGTGSSYDESTRYGYTSKGSTYNTTVSYTGNKTINISCSFSGSGKWSGGSDCSISSNSISTDASLPYVTPSYSYNRSAGTGGSIASESTANGTYASGTSITAIAAPSIGYRFNNWTGTYTSTSNPYTFTLSKATSLTANFIKTYTYNVSAGTGGLISSDSTASGTYDTGKSITAKAIADSGYRFNNWTGAPTAAPDPTYTFTLTNDVTLEANFVKIYNVNISSNDLDLGTVSSSGKPIEDEGTQITLTATETNIGYFLGWYENGTTFISSEKSYDIVVNKDINYVAKFALNQWNHSKIA